jgi:hypothetical protein
MTPQNLYTLLESGDPKALALARVLTARVKAGIASPEEAATHAQLAALHRAGSASHQAIFGARGPDLDASTAARLRAMVAQARFGKGGGGGGGGGHGGGGGGGFHGGGGGGFHGGGFRRGFGGGGWGGGWWGYPYATFPCWWDPYYGWVCPQRWWW